MPSHIFRQIRTAFRNLNPEDVRHTAYRPFTVGLVATGSEDLAVMEAFLAPPTISRNKRRALSGVLYRAGDDGTPTEFDLEIVAEGLVRPPGAFSFSPREPRRTVDEILLQREDLSLPLARHFPPFRRPVIQHVIREIATQNALFALLTALPDALPGLSAFWAAGEFASDTTVLTVNQVRMTFLIAAASDREVGYREQKTQIGAIIAGAFGWRALARELAAKIPFGGGLVPKAAVAYAGTFVVGLGLERYYAVGYGLTRSERREAYEEAFERGRAVAGSLLGSALGRNEN